MKTKRLLALACIISMLASFTACKGKSNDEDTAVTTAAETSQAETTQAETTEAEEEETETSEEAETEAVEEETETSDTEEKSISSEGIRPEVKEALDTYEKLMDEYIDFMKKYTKASPAEMTSMLADYTKFLGKQTEAIEKLDTIDQDELSKEELEYYIDVTARVEKKLLEVL